MTRSRPDLADAPGQDSFLDVVTNLVGILIIIIMVIGTRTTDAMVDASTAAETDPPATDLAAIRSAKGAVEQDIHQIDAKLHRQQLEINYRRAERDKMLAVLTAVEQQLVQQQQALSGDQQSRLAAKSQLISARSELAELQGARQALEKQQTPPQVIEHRQTPIAKMVFGKEVHFRLAGGRLGYVPWDEMVEALKKEAPQKTWKLKDSSRITETLGPVRGFRMEYTLRHGRRAAPVGSAGTAAQQTIELERFVLVPLSDDLGEPVEQALLPNSESLALLSRYDAKRVTVTVWVYPDGFGQFRSLKAKFAELGFAASARPLPEGYPIGGSPEGSRSAAE
jgi:hypothetical protein